MSFKHVLAKYLHNHAETSDHHWDTALQTHYYKITKDKGLKGLKAFFDEDDMFDINALSEEHGELSVNIKKGRKAFVIMTVIMVRPFQTAIDIAVTTESFLPFDFGYSSTCIKRLYQTCDQLFPPVN